MFGFIIVAQARRKFELLPRGQLELAIDPDAPVIEIGCGRVLNRNHEGRWKWVRKKEVVDDVLVVILVEYEHARLPAELEGIIEFERALFGRGDAELLRKL